MPRYAGPITVSVFVLLIIGLLAGQALVSRSYEEVSDDSRPMHLTLYRYFGGCADEYAHVTDLAHAVGECGVIQVLTNRFNAAHAGEILVRTQTAEWSGYYDRLSAAYAARHPPDIAVMNRSVLPSYVSRRLLLPLSEALVQAGVSLEDLNSSAREGVTFKGELFALPYDLHGLLWHLNLDILAQAGLVDGQGAAILPSSPGELDAHAKMVRAKTGKSYFAIPSQTDPMPTWTFASWVWQQQANLLSNDGCIATLETVHASRALALLVSLYERGYANPGHDYAGAEQAFLSGETAVLVNGTWVVDSYYAHTAKPHSALRRYAPHTAPQLFAVPAAWTDSHVWVLPRQESQDRRKYEAAVTFLAYLFDHSSAWARTGHLPARQSVLESDGIRRLPGREGYVDLAGIARAFPAVERHRAIQDVLAQQINATWLASQPPAEALGQAQQDVERILQRNGRAPGPSHRSCSETH